ncbi:hypothetical protein SNE40_010933 [Patella caerulea]|uniref:Nuclear envelope integral membrane protein 1 n=1 Tax=Patella caerulea TaxID=87958 RepID=A0AAN8K311_PATCE
MYYPDVEEKLGLILNAAVSTIKVKANDDGSARLFTFCHKGQQRNYLRLWINPKLTIIKTSQDQEISIYIGKNLTEVEKKAQDVSAWWKYMITLTLQVKEDVPLQAFNSSCVGISSVKPYTVQFRIGNPDVWYIAYVIAGVLLFFWAPVWSRNVMIHYGAGVSVGVLASVVLLIFILQRFLPQKLKAVGYISMLIGGSASLFMLQWMSTRIQDIVRDNWQYVLGYVIVTGLVSFALVYRYGPMKEDRSLNLLQWLLQIIGLALIYNGTQIAEASAAIIILVVSAYMFPATRFNKLKQRFRYKFFPPKPRFLTEEEYEEERDRATEKALEELRQYCKSPECQTWKVISRIKSPSKFASFVEGEDHLSDDDYHYHSEYSHILPHGDYDDDNMSEIDFRLTSP